LEPRIETSESIIPWIGKTAKFMDYFITDYMKKKGVDISISQFILLKKLHEKDGQKQNTLAYITNRSKTALSRLIQTMEKKELVYRVPCEIDMRVNYIFLTTKGRKTWERSYPFFLEIVKELQQGISSEDLITVQKAMEQIQMNINKTTNINQHL
jgi:DNA-binding MarR family transcriptional regulator